METYKKYAKLLLSLLTVELRTRFWELDNAKDPALLARKRKIPPFLIERENQCKWLVTIRNLEELIDAMENYGK